MKKTGLLLAGLCVFALLASVVAVHAAPQNANVAGTWELAMAPPAGGGGGGAGGGGGRGGPQTVTIKQDGAKISGTMSGGRGDVNFEGTVSGNDVTWTVQRPGRDGNTMTITYKGTLSGDSIKGSMSFGQGSRDFTMSKKGGA